MAIDALHVALAASPILLVLALLVTRVSALLAGAIGLVWAVVVALVWFPVSWTVAGAAVAAMAPTIIEVALILLGGVGLAEAMARTGAQDLIASWLEQVEGRADRTGTLLLLVYGMTPFMESITGFGLGVLITAPLLLRLGYAPVKAVIASLLGMVLVPWGSLAPGTLVASQLGSVGFGELGVWSGILTLPVQLVSVVALFVIVVGRPTLRQLALAGSVILTQWLAVTAVNLLVGPPLAGVIGGAVVIAGLLVVARARGPLPAPGGALWRSMLPYAVLVGGLLLTSALVQLLRVPAWEWVTSPALWVIVSAAIALLPLRQRGDALLPVLRGVCARWLPIAANAVVFLVFGLVLATAGIAAYLATAAASAGHLVVLAIPFIGALGGFLTGSNTGAAALFSSATSSMAGAVSVNPVVALAGQNVAGSFAIIASPPRIAVAVSGVMAPGETLPSTSRRALALVVLIASVVLGGVVLLLA